MWEEGGAIPEGEKAKLLLLEEVKSMELRLAHAIKRGGIIKKVGNGGGGMEEVPNVGGKVEEEEEERKENGEEVPFIVEEACNRSGARVGESGKVNLEGGGGVAGGLGRGVREASSFVLFD